MTANVSATTIIDPPSGTYTFYGVFQIPYNWPACFPRMKEVLGKNPNT